jgi:hypothetical protein
MDRDIDTKYLIDYKRLPIWTGTLFEFLAISLRASSWFNTLLWFDRDSWMDVRGVWEGVEAAEADLFLLDLKRDMVMIFSFFNFFVWSRSVVIVSLLTVDTIVIDSDDNNRRKKN